MKLTTPKRNALPTKVFALPGRKYPIEDKSHARNALARVSGNGTPAQKAEVKAKVQSKFPDIGVADKSRKNMMMQQEARRVAKK